MCLNTWITSQLCITQTSTYMGSMGDQIGPVENIECCKSLGFPWVVQFITHGHPFSLKASFESELGPLVINKFHINAHDDGLDP